MKVSIDPRITTAVEQRHDHQRRPDRDRPPAWLQWQLKRDAEGRPMFVGENRGFCSGAPCACGNTC